MASFPGGFFLQCNARTSVDLCQIAALRTGLQVLLNLRAPLGFQRVPLEIVEQLYNFLVAHGSVLTGT